LPELSSAGEVECKLSAGLTLSRRQHVRRGCNRLLRPGPWSAPQGSFPILEPWVPAEEFDEVNTHRRADPSCVRVSLNQRVA
jgi:hypothetical protein